MTRHFTSCVVVSPSVSEEVSVRHLLTLKLDARAVWQDLKRNSEAVILHIFL